MIRSAYDYNLSAHLHVLSVCIDVTNTRLEDIRYVKIMRYGTLS